MNRAKFFTALRARSSGVFGTSLSQSQVDGIEGILDAFGQVGDGRRATLAYALATGYGETERKMVPVREGFAKTDAGARRAVNNLAKKRGPNSAVAKYARPVPPYGHVYYGRGHVQLTWMDNYRRSSADAGVDLVKNPDGMLDPLISARVLIRGLMDGRWNGKGKGVPDYELSDGIPGLSEIEAVAARRTVNIQDKAATYAKFYAAFDAALDAAGMPLVETHEPPVRPDVEPAQPAPKQPVASGWLAALVTLLTSFTKGR